jgi:hypothetical protein
VVLLGENGDEVAHGLDRGVPHHLRVAIDLPEAGEQVYVPDDLRRSDPVAEVVDLWRVPLELLVADALTERGQGAEHSPAGDVPYVLAVLPKDAPSDPRMQTTMSRIIFLGTRPPLASGQPMVKRILRILSRRARVPGHSRRLGTADLDKLPLTCFEGS